MRMKVQVVMWRRPYETTSMDVTMAISRLWMTQRRWWTTEREAYDAFVTATQGRVTGTVTLRLYKGSVAVVGRALS